MTTRQALMAAVDAVEGPWQRARKDEQGIKITGLGEGEVVLMDYEIDRQLQLPIVLNQSGTFPFPSCDRFRFRKEVNGGPHATTFVEVII